MTAKEYLSQARVIDTRVNVKLSGLSRLRELATKATATLSDMPRGDSPNLQQTESVVVKIIDLEKEINGTIDKLIDLKREIVRIIGEVCDPTCRMLLELRYLDFQTWDQITDTLGYDKRWVFRLHERGLGAVDGILRMSGASA